MVRVAPFGSLELWVRYCSTPWLHRNHEELVLPLANVLREMKADGSLERYAKEVGGSWEEFRW